MTTEINLTKEAVDSVLNSLEDHLGHIQQAASLIPTTTDSRFNTVTSQLSDESLHLVSRISETIVTARGFAQDIFNLDQAEKFGVEIAEQVKTFLSGGSAGSSDGSSAINDIAASASSLLSSLTSGIPGLGDQAGSGIGGIQSLVDSLVRGGDYASYPEEEASGESSTSSSPDGGSGGHIAGFIKAVTTLLNGDYEEAATALGPIVTEAHAAAADSDPVVYEEAATARGPVDTEAHEEAGRGEDGTHLSSAGTAYSTGDAAVGGTHLSSAGTAYSTGDGAVGGTHLSAAGDSSGGERVATFGTVGEVRPAYPGTETGGVTLSKEALASVISEAIAAESATSGYSAGDYSAASAGYNFSPNAQFYVDNDGNYYVYEPGAASSGDMSGFGGGFGAGAMMSSGDVGLMIGYPVAESMLDISQVNYDRPPDGPMGQDQINAAIATAMDTLGIVDPEARSRWAGVVDYMIAHESGYAPAAGNNWDSNAIGAQQVDGLPGQASRGLMQTIPTTFAAHHVSGTSNSIYDPVANIAAGMNYMMNRYGIDQYGNGLDSFYGRRHPTYMGY